MKVERPRARSSAAPTRENRRSTTPMLGALGGHEAAGLGEDRDQRVLAQERALAGHVRPGQQPQALLLREVGVVGDEAAGASRASACSTTGWRPPPDLEGVARRRSRGGSSASRPASSARPAATSRRASACAVRAIASASASTAAAELVEQLELEGQRALGGARDLALQLGQLPGAVAGGARHALALDEMLGHLGAMGRGHLDVVAEHVVVADLERADAGLALHPALERARCGGGPDRAGRAAGRARRASPPG